MKYMGSKARIAHEIVPIIQYYIHKSGARRYWEPFVGGANVIDKIHAPVRLGTDANPYLIALLQHVQQGGELPESMNMEEYSRVRSQKDCFPRWYAGCVGFLASRCGRFFDGGYAKPEPGRNYFMEARRNLLKQAKAFSGITFDCIDYAACSGAQWPRDCVIYCDPPYKGVRQYTCGLKFNNETFWETVRIWSRSNIVLVSEFEAPADFACIWKKRIPQNVNYKNKMLVTERLFMIRQPMSAREGEPYEPFI